MEKQLEKFKLTESRDVFSCRVFSVRERVATTQDGAHTGKMYTLGVADWVNVVPVTAAGEIVLVEQHRFGVDTFTLETPGGAVDPGEKDVTMAALRELQEETGLTAQRMLALPGFAPNPAIQGNRITYFVAFDCQPMDKPSEHFDPFENIRVHYLPVPEVLEMARTGRITSALCSLAVLLAEPYITARLRRGEGAAAVVP